MRLKPYWSSEQHGLRIYHGDCLEVMPKLEAAGERFDLCLTDPPYNVGYQYAEHKDDMPLDEYRAWQLQVAEIAYDCMAPAADFWYLNYPEFAAYMFVATAEATGWEAREWVTWIYNAHTSGFPLRKASRAWCWFVKGVGGAPDFTQAPKNPEDKRVAKSLAQGNLPRAYDWWQCEQVKNVNAEKTEHPCQVPCAMVERIIEGVSARRVLDPFLGSGTTLVAAYRLGREATGIEISEEYCELAARRLEAELAQGRLFEPAEVAQPRQQPMAL